MQMPVAVSCKNYNNKTYDLCNPAQLQTMDMSPVLLLMPCFRTKKKILIKVQERCLKNEEFQNLETATGMTSENL